MKYRKLIIQIYCFCAFLTSFGVLNAQEADISEACLPVTVQFSGPDGLSNYFWDFGGQGLSNLQNPINQFVEAGVYEVILFEGQGGDSIGTVIITVYEKPVLEITLDTNSVFCTNSEVIFINSSTFDEGVSVNDWSWTFGDGDLFKGLMDPTHIYDNAGIYSIGLHLDSDLPNCSITRNFPGFVEITEVIAEFNTDPEVSSACEAPFMVSFINNSSQEVGTSYFWNFGNGQTSTEFSPNSVLYANAGSFLIELTVTNEEGCEAIATQSVFIGTPNALFDLPDTVCIGSATTIINQSDLGNYDWDFGGAIELMSGTNPIVEFPTIGEYTITLIVTAEGGCSQTFSKTVFAEELEASFISEPSYTCFQTLSIVYTPSLSDNVSDVLWLFCDVDGTVIDSSTVIEPTFVFDDSEESVYTENGERVFKTIMIVTTESGCILELTSFDTIHQPDARFMPDVASGCVPLLVTFSDSSHSNENIVEWIWDFGDGTVINASDGNDQEHSYTETGIFEVVLTIVNDQDCRDTSFIIEIKVGSESFEEIEFDPIEICVGDTFELKFDSLENWGYLTEGGPFEFCIPGNSADVIWTDESGVYDLILFVNDNGCIADTFIEGAITVNGMKANGYYEIDCSNPFSVLFADSSIISTNPVWTIDGDTISEEASFIFTFNETGDYKVVLTEEDPLGLCPSTMDTLLVCIRNIKADIELKFLQCLKQSPMLIATGSQDVYNTCWRGYKWLLPESRPITTQKDTVMDYNWPDTGKYSVSLIVNDINGCIDTTIAEVDVFDITADFIVDPIVFCVPEDLKITDLTISDTTITSWMWDIGGTMIEEQNPEINISIGEGSLDIVLTVMNDAGCSDELSQSIEIYTPESIITTTPSNGRVCLGDPITFSASDFTEQGSFLNYIWDFDNGESSTEQTFTVTYIEAGVYIVTLDFIEDASGCMGTASVEINVEVPPNADFSIPDSLCSDELITFIGEDILGTHSWILDGNSLGNSNLFSFTFTPGEYELTHILTTPAGCADTVINSFSVEAAPSGDFTINPEQVCPNDRIFLTLVDTTNVRSWVWDVGTGEVQGNTSPAVFIWNDDLSSQGTVSVILSGGSKCKTSIIKPLDIEELSGQIHLPLAFSPNGDDLNDRYRPYIEEQEIPSSANLILFKIFNRWGEVVYDNEGGLSGWDGMIDGAQAPQEVYYTYFRIFIEGCNTETYIEQDVLLVR